MSLKFLVIVCFSLLPQSLVISQGLSFCMHSGKSYISGTVWRIRNHGICRQCKCFKANIVRCLPTCNRNARIPLNPLLSDDLSKSIINKAVTGVQCIMDGKTHRNGESWTENGAHAKGLQANQCMQCNCKIKVITCAIRNCPVVHCRNPVQEDGTCCKTCQERSGRPPRESSNRGCLSIERYFQNDESWQLYLPSPNVFATCVDCSCRNGREHCRKHSCPPATCSKPIKRPGNCCSLCPGQRPLSKARKENHRKTSSTDSGIFGFFLRRDDSKSKKNPKTDRKTKENVEATVSTMRKAPIESKDVGCSFGGSLSYKHDQLFYPVLNKKTQKCTKCVCMNSVVNCARIRCPSRYPCKNPISKEGFCCKFCRGMSEKQARSLEAVQMYQNRGCSKAKRTHLQVYRYNDVTRSAAQLSAKYLFDKTHQMNNKKSEIHTLQLIDMSINITRHYLDSDDVIRNSLNKNWNYLGAIKEKMFTRLLRLERDLKRCKDTLRCIKKLTNLVDQLKTKAARRRRCRSSAVVRSLERLQK
ncbi:cysteine-rich motor neuron 1 protein-like isoform X2 [Rhopilema esculentum]|uniref:cysteine-rich motor neuron 1 protein-like isoform X1 n=1 Tax=Rhopilema esculentum TaxID=499914 RepID=UPI0031D44F24